MARDFECVSVQRLVALMLGQPATRRVSLRRFGALVDLSTSLSIPIPVLVDRRRATRLRGRRALCRIEDDMTAFFTTMRKLVAQRNRA